MNKKVLRALIYLCLAFLVAFALLKTVWAEQFAIAVSSANVVRVGSFIDNHIWLKQLISVFTTLLTYQFYLCACCHKWFLNWKQYLIFTPIIIGLTYLNFYFPAQMVGVNFVFMFVAPIFLKAKYIDVAIVLATHTLGQLAILYIRSQPMALADINIITQLICAIDAYVWLLLYYLYSNLYKETIIMGAIMPPLFGKNEKLIEKEIKKIDDKLAVEQDEKKKAKLTEKRAEYEDMLAECKK